MHTIVWKNIQWLFAGQFISRGIKGILIVIAARTLSLEYFGSFNLALGIAGAFMFVNDWGLDMLLVREIAKKTEAAFDRLIRLATRNVSAGTLPKRYAKLNTREKAEALYDSLLTLRMVGDEEA